MRSVPSVLVRVVASGWSRNAAAQLAVELGDAAEWVGVLERALELLLDDGDDAAQGSVCSGWRPVSAACG
jgi:hypothetical protein